MAKYVIEDTTLTGIADAIRAKTGFADPIAVSDMAAQIGEITGGGTSGGSADGVVYVTFMNGDAELCKTACMKGDSTIDPVEDGKIAVPTKAASVSTVYTFAGGWSLTDGGEADEMALVDVSEDRTVYAVYTESARKYTVNFWIAEGELHESVSTAYGEVPTYTKPIKDGYDFAGWTPELVAVTADANYYAQWEELPAFQRMSWAEISEICEAGTAADWFAVEDEKTFTGADGETYVLRIVGLNLDTKADGSGNAGITAAITKENKVSVADPMQWHTENTATITWGDNPSIRQWLTGTFWNRLPSDFRNVIKTVSKITQNDTTSSGVRYVTETTTDTVFLPSLCEFGCGFSNWAESVKYPGFTDGFELHAPDDSTTSIWSRTVNNGNVVFGWGTLMSDAREKSKTSTILAYPCVCI